MFAIIATLVFVTAAALSVHVIATMVMAYREKMIAALLFQPMPQAQPSYHVEIRRHRSRSLSGATSATVTTLARAA